MGNCLDSSAKVDAAQSSRSTSGNPIFFFSHRYGLPSFWFDAVVNSYMVVGCSVTFC